MGVSVVAMTHNETEKFPNGTIKLIKVKSFFLKENQWEKKTNCSLLNLIGHQESLVLLIVLFFGVILLLKYPVDI
jgi:hypothetical protein